MPALTSTSKLRWGTVEPANVYLGSTLAWTKPAAALYTETFTRSNASTWGAGWTWGDDKPATASSTISGNVGVLGYGTAGSWSGSDAIFIYANNWTGTDQDVTCRVKKKDSSGTQISLVLRCPTSVTDAGTGIHVSVHADQTIIIDEISGWSALNTWSTPFTLANDTWARLRVRLVGSTIQVKAWLDGASEPGSWMLTQTLTSVLSAGRLGFRVAGGSATASRFVSVDDIVVTAP